MWTWHTVILIINVTTCIACKSRNTKNVLRIYAAYKLSSQSKAYITAKCQPFARRARCADIMLNTFSQKFRYHNFSAPKLTVPSKETEGKKSRLKKSKLNRTTSMKEKRKTRLCINEDKELNGWERKTMATTTTTTNHLARYLRSIARTTRWSRSINMHALSGWASYIANASSSSSTSIHF